VIFAGIRTAAVQIVSAATLAAFIGGGGLDELITPAGRSTSRTPARRSGRGIAVATTRLAPTRMGRAAVTRGSHDPTGERQQDLTGAPRPAVDRLDLDVSDGTTCVLIGPSGCGKTTTMRASSTG
jgi:ABC-type multidrug transport system fused ATPase/permease subunit